MFPVEQRDPVSLNALRFINVDPTGVLDSTLGINLAISQQGLAGGGWVDLAPGVYKISSQLLFAYAGVTLRGSGGQSCILQPTPGFASGQIVLITADFCGLRDLTIAYASTNVGANPAADGVRITGARSVTLMNCYFNYINGWAIHSTGTASIANYWGQFINAHAFQCSTGMRLAGNASSGYNVAATLVDCIMDQCVGGDAFLIDDAHDVLCSNIEGSVTAGSGATFHVRGASAAVYISTVDCGPAPGPAIGPTVLVESFGGNNPKQVTFNAGILEGGLAGATITAGSQIRFVDIDFVNNGKFGVNISGAADAIVVEGCLFNLNGSSAGSGRYDVQSSTTGHVEVNDCYFLTPQGSLTQQTNNAINVTAGTVTCQNDTFSGAGYSAANIFASFPSVVRACPGYNPVGNVAISIPASTVNFAAKSSDLTYCVSGGTVTAISIGGVATGLTTGTFRVPAQQTFSITYSVVPTVVAFSD